MAIRSEHTCSQHIEVGICYARTGEFKLASSRFRQALDVDPANVKARFYLGCCLRELGMYDEAIEAFETVLVHNPDHRGALLNRISAFREMQLSGVRNSALLGYVADGKHPNGVEKQECKTHKPPTISMSVLMAVAIIAAAILLIVNRR